MSRRLSARNVVVFGGVLLVGFAAVVGYRPALLPPAVITPLEELTGNLSPRLTVLGVGVVLGMIGLGGSWVWRTKNRTTTLSDLSAEVPDHNVAMTGDQLTQQFDYERNGRYTPTEGAVEDALRGVLVRIYRREFDDEAQAQRYVDDGTWTNDRVAAATFTTTESVDFPPLYRVYAWLYPTHAYAYRIRRSLRAVEDASSEQLSAYSPTERSTSRWSRLRAILVSDTEGDRQ